MRSLATGALHVPIACVRDIVRERRGAEVGRRCADKLMKFFTRVGSTPVCCAAA
jgi:hypothetical protein